MKLNEQEGGNEAEFLAVPEACKAKSDLPSPY